MSEYRTVATLTSEGTFVVPGPAGLPAGTQAEVTVRVEEAPAEPVGLSALLDRINARPVDPDGTHRSAQAQSLLRKMREEWD